jgi:hypothetical protein
MKDMIVRAFWVKYIFTGISKLEDLSRAYWAKHKRVLLIAVPLGFGFVAFSMYLHNQNRGYILGLCVLLALLSSPFTLKTASGRLWWLCFATAVGSGTAATFLGPYNILSWVLSGVVGFTYAIGVCLRWNPPGLKSPQL